jgi:2-(1,2-epoxy-1,2-dihydrophenyl)acetyl-CoA isomerase
MYKSFESDLETSLKLEGELQDIAVNTADYREGVKAFLEKRSPHYHGR